MGTCTLVGGREGAEDKSRLQEQLMCKFLQIQVFWDDKGNLMSLYSTKSYRFGIFTYLLLLFGL